jgi:glutathione synthase/RimK-type ligase-like ATP-grasp enzyme
MHLSKILFVPRIRPYSFKYYEDMHLFKQIVQETRRHAKVQVSDLTNFELLPKLMKTTVNCVCSMARASLALRILSCYEYNGIPVVNRSSAVRICGDRISIVHALETHDIPTLCIGFHRKQFKNIVFPVIFKSYNSHSLHDRTKIIAYSSEDVRRYMIKLKNNMWISEYYIPHSKIMKFYVVGNEILYVKIKYANSNKFECISLNGDLLQPRIMEWCLKIGKIFGLEVYNVEILNHLSRNWVIDVNDFPSFATIPDAPHKISEYIMEKVNKQ